MRTGRVQQGTMNWILTGYATFVPGVGRWNWTYSNFLYSPPLRFTTSGPRASLLIRDPRAGPTPKLLVDWHQDGALSASSYHYSFEFKNVLQVDHYLGRVLSDSVKIGFESAVVLDECLTCLPRGEEKLRAVDREVNGGSGASDGVCGGRDTGVSFEGLVRGMKGGAIGEGVVGCDPKWWTKLA